jgi:hypothetical protein
LRHYATSQKVAGSIPDEVIGFSIDPNPSSCNVALGPTQLLTEIFLGIKGGLLAHKADYLTSTCEPIV